MLFSESDEPLLKTWLERRLARVSDAEAPILAEYCIALLRHDQGEEDVFNLCVDQLGDFLKGDTRSFVSDVFLAIKDKTFLSKSTTSRPPRIVKFPEESRERLHHVDPASVHVAVSAPAPVSKRPNGPSSMEPPMRMPMMPLPPPEMVLDPAFIQFMQQQADLAQRPNRKRKRCFAFLRSGVCQKGSACPYEHVSEQRNYHEYDPNFSGMSGSPSNQVKAKVLESFRPPKHDEGSHNNVVSKCSLSIEGIPSANLNEASLAAHFSKFGTVKSIEILQESNKAVVSFIDQNAAQAAFNSPAAVFDNRFVKVLWSRAEQSQQELQHSLNRNQTGRSREPVQEIIPVDSLAAKQAEHEERLRKKLELEKRSIAVRQQMEALKRQQSAQEELIRQMDSRENLSESPEVGAKSDTRSALQAQLAELKGKAASLGISQQDLGSATSHRNTGRGRGAFRGRGRGRATPYHNAGPKSLDLRPKTLRIECRLPSDQVAEQVRERCEYDSIQVEKDGSVVVGFKSRHEAESFSATNRSLGDMSWVRKEQSNGVEHELQGTNETKNSSDDRDMDRYDD